MSLYIRWPKFEALRNRQQVVVEAVERENGFMLISEPLGHVERFIPNWVVDTPFLSDMEDAESKRQWLRAILIGIVGEAPKRVEYQTLVDYDSALRTRIEAEIETKWLRIIMGAAADG
jgi:hypothetical protein